MPLFQDLTPAPGAAPDWAAIAEAFDWFRRMADCPQDPVFHAEGDVQIHTRMVCEALLARPEWSALDATARRALFWAALLHDVAKPERTRVAPDGRISAPGHARRGAIQARRILWRLEAPFAERETVCALVEHHLAPFRLLGLERPEREAHRISWRVRCDRLALLAEADAAGRVCPDAARLRDEIALFREFCAEEACLDAPKAFASDHTRFLYFRGAERLPDVEAYDDTRCVVTLTSGLPAAGKDRWVARWMAANHGAATVVSLDALRQKLRVAPSEPQGRVVAAARELARDALRRGQPLIWNATNLSRALREPLIDLMAGYGARVRIVYLEAPETELLRRNAERESPVADKAIRRMLERWEPPDPTECHELALG